MNRGSLGEGIDRGRDFPASMRPRFMNRGSAGYLERKQLQSEASMRPRFMNRGSLMKSSLNPTTALLQ